MAASRPAAARGRGGDHAGSGLVLAVDRIACDGYGTCAEMLPELITLDDWGYPILRGGEVPADLLAHARAAVDSCPVLALRLADGGRATIGTGAADPRRAAGAVTWAPARPDDR